MAVRERPVSSFAEGLALFVAVFANANDEIDARRELSALRQHGATSTVDLYTAAFLSLVQRIRTDPPNEMSLATAHIDGLAAVEARKACFVECASSLP